jgi:Protoglobin
VNQPERTAASPIPGYDYGTSKSAVSPLSQEDLARLEQTAGWTAQDAEVLARHAAVFQANAESMVDAWRAVIGSQPHLAHWFVKPDGAPDDDYKASVKRRFVQWVVDVAQRPHDQDWLNYQHEIGLRHTPAKKNKTDSARTPPVVPFRYLLGFVPVVLPIRKFFAGAIQDDADLDRLEAAWTRAVLLHVTLWSRAYIAEELW